MNRNYYLDDIYLSESFINQLKEYSEINLFINENKIRNYDPSHIIDLSNLPSNISSLYLNITGKVNMIPSSIKKIQIDSYGEELFFPENIKEVWLGKDYLINYSDSYKNLPENIEQLKLIYSNCIDITIDLDFLPQNINSVYITTLYNNEKFKINISKIYSKLKNIQFHEIYKIDLTEIKKYCDENKITFINSYYEIVGC
jgi:hypothetical protein